MVYRGRRLVSGSGERTCRERCALAVFASLLRCVVTLWGEKRVHLHLHSGRSDSDALILARYTDPVEVRVECTNKQTPIKMRQTPSLLSKQLIFTHPPHARPHRFCFASSSLTEPPLARHQTSPPHLIILSQAAVGPSTAGRTSK